MILEYHILSTHPHSDNDFNNTWPIIISNINLWGKKEKPLSLSIGMFLMLKVHDRVQDR